MFNASRKGERTLTDGWVGTIRKRDCHKLVPPVVPPKIITTKSTNELQVGRVLLLAVRFDFD
jgi:hypothetical protein